MSDDSVIGTPMRPNATKVLICGAGELGKEVAIELQRYGVEVIAIDRYAHAPAMQVAHKSYVLSMLDGPALREIVEAQKPDYIVPEIEAIATDTLIELESEGYHVIPSAKATSLTMNREGIRRLAAQELDLPTSPFRFASNLAEMTKALEEIGYPALVKPIMSSSGKGQSHVACAEEASAAWSIAQECGRAGNGRVIVEGFVDFDYEITLLTVRTGTDTVFCEPIGHEQVNGDYRMSCQPKAMSERARQKAEHIARTVTDALGGRGVFGVELFVRNDEVIFSEVSPRPHDTGLVTLISQELSQFALHARCILGLPIPSIEHKGPSASVAILGEGESEHLSYRGLAQALQQPQTEVRLFGKPAINGVRRLGVALARDETLDKAIEKARDVSRCIEIMKDEGASHDI